MYHLEGFLAKQKVYMSVTLFLYRSDLDLEDQKLPTMNEAEASLGAMKPIGDIKVEIRG